MRHIAMFLALLFCALQATAETPIETSANATAEETAVSSQKAVDIRSVRPSSDAATAKAQEATIDFTGAGFGSGIALVIGLGEKQRVKDAEVVNNVVRVKSDSTTTPRILLNLHYFFSDACDGGAGKFCVEQGVDAGGRRILVPMRGWGPFVAVQPGSDQTVAAVGGGVLFGWRRAVDKPDSFNVGAGVLADQNVRTLGDGIYANQALPAGETQIRYKESTRWGVILMASWAF